MAKDADGQGSFERHYYKLILKDWWDYAQAELKVALLRWVVLPTPRW